jgi:hypothetical protein
MYQAAKAVGKEALKTGSSIINYVLNKKPEQHVNDIFKDCFGEKRLTL